MSLQETEFYKELDEHKKQPAGKKQPKNFTIAKLGIILAIILCLGEIFIFYFAKSIKSGKDDQMTNASTSIMDQSFSKVEISPSQFEIVISEGVLCSKILMSTNKSLACSINEEGILIFGKISSLLPQNANILIWPSVKQEKISLEVKSVKIGKINIPKIFGSIVISPLNKIIEEQISGSRIRSIDLSTSIMIILADKIT